MPLTLMTLYQAVTRDTAAPQSAIEDRFNQLSPRRQRIIRARVDGRTLKQIGLAEGVGHSAVQSAIIAAMQRIRREIAGEIVRPGRNQHKKTGASVATVCHPCNGPRVEPRPGSATPPPPLNTNSV